MKGLFLKLISDSSDSKFEIQNGVGNEQVTPGLSDFPTSGLPNFRSSRLYNLATFER